MEMEHQQQTNWCWAAVAVSVHNLLNAPDTLTQGEVATRVLKKKGKIGAAVNCAATPGKCNYQTDLHYTLNEIGNLYRFLSNQILPFNCIKDWVNRDLPVPARIKWYGGGAHFVAIDGYREFQSGAKQVAVQDPWYGFSFQYYEDFLDDYLHKGYWLDTYLVRR